MRLARLPGSSIALVFLAAAGVAPGGCDAGAPTGLGPAAAGGPNAVRLRPWQLEPAGAAPVLLGITDTVEGQRCTFLADTEGQLRCLPPSPPSLSSDGFADASCTTPLYRMSLADAAAFVGRPLTLPAPPFTSCGSERHVVGIARQVPDAVPRYQAYAGVCSETPPVGSPGGVGIVVDVVAPARYVAGTVVDGVLLGGRVRVREVATADGARFADHLVDERWGKRCTLLATEDGAATCRVEELEAGNYFRDAACAEGVQLGRAESCADPAYLRVGKEVFTLGLEWRGDVFEQVKTCRQTRGAVAVPLETDPVFYQPGVPLGGDVVARATWKTEGAARFATRGLRGDDGRLVALADAVRGEYPPAFHDNVTGDDCRAIATRAGDVRCLPASVHAGWIADHVFADAACTKVTYYCDPDDCNGFAFVAGDPTTFLQPSATRPAMRLSVAIAVPSGSVYTDINGACVATMSSALFTAGAEVPWDEYPSVPVTGAPPR